MHFISEVLNSGTRANFFGNLHKTVLILSVQGPMFEVVYVLIFVRNGKEVS